MSPPNHPRLSRRELIRRTPAVTTLINHINVNIAWIEANARFTHRKTFPRLENATSATQIPNDNRKKTIPKKVVRSFAFNRLFRWRCSV